MSLRDILQADRDTQGTGNGAESIREENVFTARPYQVEILQHALEKNTIVCLGTGTGKTFISVMLIRERAYQIEGLLADGGKRTFFLVPSVPLVYQQSQVLETHSTLRIGKYIGDMGVDFWTREDWEKEFNKNQVLVMTAQILCNMLGAGHIGISNINVLLLDECHNATKNHVYVQIMKFFSSCRETDQPRIMGLTASIVNTKCKARQMGMIHDYLNEGMRNLELTLRSVCVTCSDPASSGKYAAKPEESVVTIESPRYDEDALETVVFTEINNIISETDNFFELTEDTSSRKMPFGVMPKAKVSDIWDDVCKQLQYILQSLGLWCTYKAAGVFIEEIERHKKMLRQEMECLALEYIATQLRNIRRKFENYVTMFYGNIESIQVGQPLVSNKIIKLLNILQCVKQDSFINDTNLCAIVFTQRRVTAVVLSETINDMVNSNIEHYSGICSQYILGHNIGADVRLSDSAMSSRIQANILKKFRQQVFNVLVSTSVVEEGLDVPKCNLVIKFDGITTFREYAQSKGRARARPSRFLVFAEDGCKHDVECNLEVMRVIEQLLQEKCQDRELPDEDDIEEYMANLDALLPPYFGGGDDPVPRLTKDNAIQLLHMYCDKLSRDVYASNKPYCHFRKVSARRLLENKGYIASITMPKNCPIVGCIEGDEMPSLKLAKKSAAMKVCIRLQEIGEVDNRFLSKKIGDTDEEEEENDDIDIPTIGKNSYLQKVPDCFLGTRESPKTAFYICFISMTLKTLPRQSDLQEYFEKLLNGGEKKAFGMLMRKPFPKIPKFSIYTHAGEVEIEFKSYQQQIHVTGECIEKIKYFHKYVFDNFCQAFIKDKEFVEQCQLDLLVFPLSVGFVQILNKCNDFNGSCSPIDLPLLDHTMTKQGNSNFDALETTYREKSKVAKYLVLKVRKDISVSSLMENGTYSHYYKTKYNIDLPPKSIFVDAYRVPSGKQYLIPEQRGEMVQESSLKVRGKLKRIEILPLQICSQLPLPADLVFQAICLPASLHRMISFLLVQELRNKIIKEVGDNNYGEIRRDTSHHTAKCHQYQENVSADANDHYSILKAVLPKFPVHVKRSCDDETCTKRTDFDRINFTGEVKLYFQGLAGNECFLVPDAKVFLTALTTRRAHAGFDLERYEFLGDSFLKMAVSISVFIRNGFVDEGKLTRMRKSFINNEKLAHLAFQKGLEGRLNHSALDASWNPPRFKNTSVESASEPFYFLAEKIPKKTLADSVEALIGAFLEEGGGLSALKLMEWFTLLPSDSLPIDCGTTAFQNMDDWYKPHNFKNLEKSLGYEFQNKSILIEAFVHMSYHSSKAARCYQRLEFLGDAILDFLVSHHLFRIGGSLSPGEMTDLRSALVNNNTFSLLSVQQKFHQYLQYSSPSLFGEIKAFVDYVNAEENTVEELLKNPFIFIMDEDEGGRNAPKVFGDMFESVAGAIFIDSGKDLDVVWRVFAPILLPVIERYMVDVPKHPFRKVQEMFPSAKASYQQLDDGRTQCSITFDDQTFKGLGQSRANAKLTVANKVLKEMEKRSP